MPVTSVCVIGAGHVGAPHAIVMASKCPNIKVTVVDDDERKIAGWNSSLLPFFEPGMQEQLDDVRSQRNIVFTSDFDSAVKASDLILVSVSTPLKESGVGAGYAPSLEYWEQVARRIAKVANGPKIIVERSTVPVKTASTMGKVFKSTTPHPVVVLSNPEFAREGSAMMDQLSPDRVMIGGPETPEGRAAVAQLKEVYSNWVPGGKIITSNLWSAEITKLTADAFLAQRISSINAISALCEKTGADVDEVSYAIGVDSRIGRKCLTASLGFGGVCYETHLRNLVYLAKMYRMNTVATYWDSVIKMNDWQKQRFAMKVVAQMFNTVGGKKIAVLGFSYKKNTSDCRFSAAIDVCKTLANEQANLVVYDPRVTAEAIGIQFTKPDGETSCVTVESDPYAAMYNAHAILVLTEWDEFARLDFGRVFESMQKPAFIFDGRNMLDHAALRAIGFTVYGAAARGRRRARPEAPRPPHGSRRARLAPLGRLAWRGEACRRAPPAPLEPAARAALPPAGIGKPQPGWNAAAEKAEAEAEEKRRTGAIRAGAVAIEKVPTPTAGVGLKKIATLGGMA